MSKLELEDLCKGCGFYDVCKTKNEKNILKNEIRELKTLLKECREFFEEENPKDFTVMSERMDELLTKITNAIGEKK